MKNFWKNFLKVLGVIAGLAAVGAAVYFLLKKYGIFGDCDMDCENCDLDCECAGSDEADDFDEREYVSIQPISSDEAEEEAGEAANAEEAAPEEEAEA